MSQQADAFEDRLAAMFADPPPAPDAELFATAVERRLAANARLRRRVYAACLAGSLGLAFLILTVTGGWGADLPGLVNFEAFTFDWMNQLGPAVGALLLVWLIVELAPTPYRR
jgi:hypothetical protein